MTEYLTDVCYKDTIPFIPPVTSGKVIKVYDGDTITIASKLPFDGCPLYRFSVRINGIDCPEMRTKNETEKTCAKLAKKKVYDALFNKIVELRNVKLEKYGRVLADVYYNDDGKVIVGGRSKPGAELHLYLNNKFQEKQSLQKRVFGI